MSDIWQPGDPIGYVQTRMPDFDLPSYRGERYSALVPDTLDLQERARLAIHCMTESTDPAADREIYFMGYLRSKPPQLIHDWQGPTVQVKFQEAVPLLRLMCGSEQNLDVERTWMEVTLRSLGDDGLIYIPEGGRPWAYRHGPKKREGSDGQLLVPFINGRLLSTMSIFAQRDRGSPWRDHLRRLVDAMADLAVDAGEIAYYWPSVMDASKEKPTIAEATTDAWAGGETSRIPHGLIHAFRLLDYERTLPLARKLLTGQRHFFFSPDGVFHATPGDPMQAHFHSHAHGLLAMEEYAEVTNDQEMMEFVVRSFEWARNIGVNQKGRSVGVAGEPLLGYFPMYTNSIQWEGSEVCEVADMIALALRLSEAEVGDYWDDADRWIRNMFAEEQLQSTDWIYRIQEVGLTNPSYGYLMPSIVGPWDTGDRVPERTLGAFAGYAAPNDWFVGYGNGIMHCCTANGSQALYRIWNRILRHQDGQLRVNLLLNRASPWADLDSYIPYQGRVDLKVKQPLAGLAIRIPEWVTPRDTRARVGESERGLEWEGRYARIGAVRPGDVVSLTFPIAERTDIVHVEKQRYHLIRKGSEVVAIDPVGKFCPLFQRQHYRENTPRWRQVTRLVSDERIEW